MGGGGGLLMTLSYIEMIMLSMFGHSIYLIFCKEGFDRFSGFICVICNIIVLILIHKGPQ